MSKKSPAPKKNSTRQPLFTDPHLLALIMHIGNVHTDDRDSPGVMLLANADAAARTILTSQPLHSAFVLLLDRPSIYSEVRACVRKTAAHWTDPKDSVRAVEAMEAAWDEEADEVRYEDVRDTMPGFIDAATIMGACLMYRLLKGGPR